MVSRLPDRTSLADKCRYVLQPKKIIEYLGLTWDSGKNRKMLPTSIILNISNSTIIILYKNIRSWKEAKQLLGKLNFACNAVPLTFLYCRVFSTTNRSETPTGHGKKYKVKEELTWWQQNLSKTSTLQIAPPSTFVTTGTSYLGSMAPRHRRQQKTFRILEKLSEALALQSKGTLKLITSITNVMPNPTRENCYLPIGHHGLFKETGRYEVQNFAEHCRDHIEHGTTALA